MSELRVEGETGFCDGAHLSVHRVHTLAEVLALAQRCKEGDADALREYPAAVKTLLDNIWNNIDEDCTRKAEYQRLWDTLADLNVDIIEGLSDRIISDSREARGC
jgi:hypothetical protein